MSKFVAALVCVAAAASFASTASAIPPFKKEFDAKYLKEPPMTPAEKALAESVKKVKCDVCHGNDENGKPSKKVRNAYGEALAKLLDKKDDAKKPEKIQEALGKVAEEKSNPDDESSPTFGELLAEGKLPGGEEKE